MLLHTTILSFESCSHFEVHQPTFSSLQSTLLVLCFLHLIFQVRLLIFEQYLEALQTQDNCQNPLLIASQLLLQNYFFILQLTFSLIHLVSSSCMELSTLTFSNTCSQYYLEQVYLLLLLCEEQCDLKSFQKSRVVSRAIVIFKEFYRQMLFT